MMLHIFRKDAKRLWPAVAVSMAVLASLARLDRWRSDYMPGAAEGYLNLLMPVVWAALLGLAVELDPLAGTTQFWITRPCRRGALLAAKLLFAVLFVHLPLFAADCYILAARGFPPVQHLPALLTRQAVFAGALTLPALALASLVRNFTHFILELVGAAALALVLSGMLGGAHPFYLWEPFTAVRAQAMVVVAAAASAAILYLQYRSRRLLVSRVLAAGSAVLASLLFVLFVPANALAVRASTNPARGPLALRLDPSRRRQDGLGRGVTVRLPIALTGVPDGTRAEMVSLWSQISAAGGPSYEDRMPTKLPAPGVQPYRLYMDGGPWMNRPPEWITLQFAAPVYDGLSARPVTLRGEAAVRLFRQGTASVMSIGETRDIAGVGRCTASMATTRLEEQMVKLECESPERSPYQTQATLINPSAAANWTHRLGDARTASTGPMTTWLSPLYRDDTYWQLAPHPAGFGSQWLVPAELAPGARIEILPQQEEGYAAIRFEFRNLDLRQ